MYLRELRVKRMSKPVELFDNSRCTSIVCKMPFSEASVAVAFSRLWQDLNRQLNSCQLWNSTFRDARVIRALTNSGNTSLRTYQRNFAVQCGKALG